MTLRRFLLEIHLRKAENQSLVVDRDVTVRQSLIRK